MARLCFSVHIQARHIATLAILLGLSWQVTCAVVTNDTTHVAEKTFDYVITGAGLSGLTVGNRLSGKGHSVLIIEAGPDGSWNPAIRNAEDHAFPPEFCNWKYPVYDEDGRQLQWTANAGACIGGSTSINGMVWYRPTKPEIDKLETLGNPGWNFENLFPYIKATERSIPPNEVQASQGAGNDPEFHGRHGFINTSFPTPMRIPKAVGLYKQALQLAFPGLGPSGDMSNRTSFSLATTLYTIWHDPVTGKNRRSSAADGLLWATEQQRPTLTVLAAHKVEKVLFDKKLTATGISFLPTDARSLGRSIKVYARKGVILSAGSLATPPILERSGIGRSDVLKAAGIHKLVDLPGVGANLNDQPDATALALMAEAHHNDTSIIDGLNGLFAPVIALIKAHQLWGSNSNVYLNNLTSSTQLRFRAQALVDAKAAVNIPGAEAILNATIDLIVTHKLPVAEFLSDTATVILLTAFWPLLPLSRGNIHINTSTPFFSHPIITPRFLHDPFDASVAVSLARASRTVFSSSPFLGIVADAYFGTAVGSNGTDEEHLAWYKSQVIGASHWLGSTSMMPRRLGGVVDSKLRVYGTKNLHVVDAGVLPFQVTSHMMSVLYAVAGRAADVIHNS
ncbi:alcohol oxidase [Podospora aff. communis PSN243]|uniref:Alcohol oxidase n=1 Tax=Podospora aff. communis PSN243 TaxID=3040156 RepID=A0AAV9GLM8_9PEZI|nr:alcohol oxidase [Podospora aff. communis PSN243]